MDIQQGTAGELTREALRERAFSLEEMRGNVAQMAGKSHVEDDEDLIGLGLDSIAVMRLASLWLSRGVQVKFSELIERRTLAEWWDLASSRQTAVPEAKSKAQPAPAVDESAPFDLSTMQLAYWIGRSPKQTLGVECHYYLEFDGEEVEPKRLETAIHRLIQRHDMLRARFYEDGRQQIMPQSPWRSMAVHDFRSLTPEEAAAKLLALRDRESHRRLDMERGEGLDVQLSLLPGGRARIHVNIAMLVCDAMSFRILMDELAQLYLQPSLQLPPVRYSYPRYLAEKSSLRQQDRARARAYWNDRLRDLGGAPQLPLALEPERVDSPRVARREHWLSPEEWRDFSELARKHNLTLPMVLMTAFAEVLSMWSTEPRFVLNVPLFDRENLHPDVTNLVGDFSSSILFGVDMSGDLPFAERAARIQAKFRADAAHSAYPGVDVLRDLSRARPGEATTAAAVVFTSAIGIGDLFSARVRKTLGNLAWMISQTSQVWLDHQVTELDGGLLLNWDAVEPLFPEGMLDSMFAAYLHLLNWLRAAETDWNAPVPDLLPASQRKMRARINASSRPRSGRLLHQGFFEEAARRPERLALAWGDNGEMSYGELSERARRIAGALLREGMQPGDKVAVALPKGHGQIEAVLGILYGGGVYVPVGVDQPLRRRARIYSSAGVRLAVSHAAERFDLGEEGVVKVLALDECRASAALEKPAPVSDDALAYIIFTSGSTGEPKGVMVPHRAAMNTIEDILSRFQLGENDRVLAVSSLDFDWSVADIFELLSAGGAVVLISEEERRDAARWVELVRRWQITLWQSVPALLDMLLLASAEKALGASLRLVMLGGDWAGLDLWGRLQEAVPGCRLAVLGGITETSIHCTVHEVTEVLPHWRSVPYGVPLTNVKCRVADLRRRDCPDWVAGELWVGGAGVSNGYVNDPERTARQFVEYDGERWYRSGDRARYMPDGSLEFLGRADSQIKIRGHRIELGEIQAAIDEFPEVAQSCVTTIGDHSQQLAAAIVAKDSTLDLGGLRAFLADRLPAYMVPEHIAVLDQLPLTENGKIDRAQIRQRLSIHGGEAAALDPPRGEVEKAVAAAWSELLGVSRIGRDDSFFALGGDSLLATKLAARLRSAGLEGFVLRQLFELPQLKDFVATLQWASTMPKASLSAIVADQDHRYEPFPLTEVQRAYWLGRSSDFTLGGVGSYWYWEFDGAGVDLARLEEALNRLVRRHEMMRAILDDDGTQHILRQTPRFTVSVTNAVPGDEQNSIAGLRLAMSHRIMDPTCWPLFAVRAVRYGDNRVRIGFGFDYIVLDALSITIIFSELATLYNDPETSLPPVEVSFRDYVLSVHPEPAVLAADEEFWEKRKLELPPPPQLPLRVNPASIAHPRFVRREMRLGSQQWLAIKERARKHNLTASSALATAFAGILSAWSSQPDLTINLTLFDRQEMHRDINNVVGDFTSLLLVPYAPVAGEGWISTARRFQEQLWLGLEHKTVSALSVIRDLARLAGTAELPMPVVFTSTLGVADKLAGLSMPFGEYAGGLSQTPQIWLDNQVVEFNGELLVNWDAVEELFPEGMLDAMFGAYRQLLQWLGGERSDWHAPMPDLLPAGQRAVRQRVNGETAPVPRRLLHEGFFEHAARHPERRALAWGDSGAMNYGELAQRVLRVAAYLRHLGINPGDLVAVVLPKGTDQITAVLGVLAAGGTYVPVGVDQPVARREAMRSRAGVRFVLDSLEEALKVPPLDSPAAVSADSLAYIIFTSGSTGEPKGVEITHRAAMNTIDAINQRFGVNEADSVLAVSALDFDLSVYDVFGLLTAGGSIVLIEEESRREARRWLELVNRRRVTVWNTVPALLDMLLIVAAEEHLDKSLRLALVSGDWVGLDLHPRLKSLAPECRLIAMGGATEAAIWSNIWEVEEVPQHWTSIPYGYPLPNQKYRVVNAQGRDCPDYVPGELWIGGAGVAAGYRNDSELTARKFVRSNGERWYRTGDMGRYSPGGILEFLGRTDHQVKIRGHRIELGEIEAALESSPDIARAVVVAIGEKIRSLAACVVARQDHAIDPAQLNRFLAGRVPAYMVPERIVVLDDLPLSANGKVDRKAIMQLLSARPAEPEEDAPQGAIETWLTELWAALLEIPQVDRKRSFFALGGDSLLATRMLEKLKRRFGLELTLRQLFAAPTVKELSALIVEQQPEIESKSMEEGVL